MLPGFIVPVMLLRKLATSILFHIGIMFVSAVFPAVLHPAAAQSAAVGPTIVVDEMLLAADDGMKTRFTIFLSRPIETKTFVIERPNRVVIEMPEVTFALEKKKEPRREGLVSALRYGLFAIGRSRIVLELARPAAVTRTLIEEAPDGRSKLIIELMRVEQETFHKTALADAIANARQPAAVPVRMAKGDDDRPLIMIDPGHGGIDAGAKAGDVSEKDIVFAFAKTLKDILDKEGKYRVAMTRDSDVFVPLDERMNMARAARADLFVSIHADTISYSQVRGFTIYTGSEKATDAESARLAEKENGADAVGGMEVAQASEEIADILQDLTLRETRSFSNRLAGLLVAHLETAMPVNKNPHRMAGFRVLRAPDVPSALIELGYMSSARDFDLLMSDEWRAKSAEALAKAFDQYFASRPAN